MDCSPMEGQKLSSINQYTSYNAPNNTTIIMQNGGGQMPPQSPPPQMVASAPPPEDATRVHQILMLRQI